MNRHLVLAALSAFVLFGCGNDADDNELTEEDSGGPELGTEALPLWTTGFLFNPTADARVQSDTPTTNYGSSALLRADGSPDTRSYLRFDVKGVKGTVKRAVLRLWVTSPTNNGPSVFSTSSGWTESSITWSNAPAPVGPAIADLGALPESSYALYDVTSAVTGDGELNFILVSTSSDGVTFNSRNTIHQTHRPRLEILTDIDEPCDPGSSGQDSCSYRGDGVRGTTNFVKQLGTQGVEAPRGLAALPGGDLLFALRYQGNDASLDGNALGTHGLAVARMSADTSVRWIHSFPTTSYADMTGLAAHPQGGTAIVGVYDVALDLGTGPLTEAYPQTRKMFVAKLDDTGAPLWAKGFAAFYRRSDGSTFGGLIIPHSVQVADDGSVYVGGSFQGHADFGAGDLYSGSKWSDIAWGGFLAKFDANGQHVWSRAVRSVGRYEGDVGALALDDDGNLLVGGAVSNRSDLGDGQISVPHSLTPFLMKLAPSGRILWKRLLSGATGRVWNVAASQGRAFFAGEYRLSFTFAGTSHTRDDAYPDGFVGALGSDGTDEWMNTFGSLGGGEAALKLAPISDGIAMSGSCGGGDLGGGLLGGGGCIGAFSGATGAHLWSRGTLPQLTSFVTLASGELAMVHELNFLAHIEGVEYRPVNGGVDTLYFRLRP